MEGIGQEGMGEEWKESAISGKERSGKDGKGLVWNGAPFGVLYPNNQVIPESLVSYWRGKEGKG